MRAGAEIKRTEKVIESSKAVLQEFNHLIDNINEACEQVRRDMR